MKISEFFKRFFSRRKRTNEQQSELNFRITLSEVRRQATAMRKEVERCRNEAYRLEMSGNHAAAVSKAAEAANSQKAYEAAQNALQRCESMHAQAKSQKLLTNLLSTCETMSEMVIDQVDTDEALRIQTRLQQTTAQMEEVQEGMAAFQEGFEPNAEPALRMAAGEDALADIIAERAARETPVEPIALPAEPADREPAPVPLAEDADLATHAEWVREKRRQLADIA